MTMRILIVGGGIAGLTLAALLRQRGEEPLVIEKASAYGEVGYVLSLWPLGSRVLRGLWLEERYEELSQTTQRYIVHNGRGALLADMNLDALTGRYGELRTLARADLLDLLRSAGEGVPVVNGCTVEALTQAGEVVQAWLSDGSEREFDLVVGADGIHSRVRRLVFGDVPLKRTGWTLWGWWAPPSLARNDAAQEFWGAGRFLGFYPALGQIACAAAFPTREDGSLLAEARAELLRQRLHGMGGKQWPLIARSLSEAPSLDATEIADLDMPHWSTGRIVLIGDASAAILPTAGVGASMAMGCAAVLNDELSRADARHVADAIAFFIARRRSRVDAIQRQSRQLLRLMMVSAPPLALARNLALRFAPKERLLQGVTHWMKRPI